MSSIAADKHLVAILAADSYEDRLCGFQHAKNAARHAEEASVDRRVTAHKL